MAFQKPSSTNIRSTAKAMPVTDTAKRRLSCVRFRQASGTPPSRMKSPMWGRFPTGQVSGRLETGPTLKQVRRVRRAHLLHGEKPGYGTHEDGQPQDDRRALAVHGDGQRGGRAAP